MSSSRAVTAARLDAEKLLAAEIEWCDKWNELHGRLSELEAGAGKAALDASLAGADDPAGAAGAPEIARVRAEIEIAERAIAAARDARRESIQACFRAEGAELRKEAKALRGQANRHKRKTDELLAKLKEHEGCAYVPFVPELVGAAEVRYSIPRSVALLGRAEELDRQATQAEARPVPEVGAVSAATAADLARDVTADPMRMGPSLIELERWAGEAEERERARVRSSTHDREIWERPITRYEITCRDGRIVDENSRASTEPAELVEA